jgi:hypothetical protein
MRDDHASSRDFRRHMRQHVGDVLVGQSVKAVSLHTGTADLARQGNHFRDGWLSTVKTRVEACDLWDIWQPVGSRFYRCKIVRLMQRGEWHQAMKFRNDLWCYQRRAGEARAAMHYSMANAHYSRSTVR